jgi:hypothetical protein
LGTNADGDANAVSAVCRNSRWHGVLRGREGGGGGSRKRCERFEKMSADVRSHGPGSQWLTAYCELIRLFDVSVAL